MKKIILPAVLLLLGIAPQPILAQRRAGNPHQMAERMADEVDSLVITLKLTEEQETPVRAILQAHNTERLNMRRPGSRGGNLQEMRTQLAQLQTKTTQQLADVLTEEQMNLYQQYLESVRGRRRIPRR